MEDHLNMDSPNQSTNRQAIGLVAIFACVLLSGALFAYYFLFISPYSVQNEKTIGAARFEKPVQESPTPTPTINPWVIIKKAYANPFDEETQYTNPFDENRNPFDNL